MVRKIIHVNDDQCTGCGECVRLCKLGALEMSGGRARLVADNMCDELGICAARCPQDALLLERREAAAFRGQYVGSAAALPATRPGASGGVALADGPSGDDDMFRHRLG